MLEVNDVLPKKIEAEKEPCIYFLINDEEIVYVGQSVDLYGRLSVHLKNKEFDSYAYFKCDLEELNELEAHYILKFSPIYNDSLPQNKYYKSLNQLKKILDVNMWDLRKIIGKNKIKEVGMGYYDIRDFNGVKHNV